MSIKYETKVIKSNFCDYSHGYILVKGDIKVIGINANTNVAFKNFAPFTRHKLILTHRYDEHIDTAENLDITLPMYNLIEYSNNYSDTSESLRQFKRDASHTNNNGNLINVSTDNSLSFRYKSSILRKTAAAFGDHRVLRNVKTVVPLKYLSNFWRSEKKLLEMPLINCKTHLQLNWTKNCVMHDSYAYAAADNSNRETIFKITNTELFVPIVTLSTKDNVKLTRQLNDGFKRLVYWNEYKPKVYLKDLENCEATDTRIYMDASFQGVKRLFVTVFHDTYSGETKLKKTDI